MLISHIKVNNNVIESIYVHNDSTGNNEVANYDVTYINPVDNILVYTRINNWYRSMPGYKLINEARVQALKSTSKLNYADALTKANGDLTEIVR